MKYHHRFLVHAPVQDVADFHRLAASMANVTPPTIRVQFKKAPERLSEGDEIEFVLWLLIFPVTWSARIYNLNASGFTDDQVAGPFKRWTHRHRFLPKGDAETEVIDEIELHLRRHLLWGGIGLAMWLGLPLLFAYRAWKTRQILARTARGIPAS